MFPIIQLGPFALPARGMILLATLWVAVDVAGRAAKRSGMREDDIFNLVFTGLIFGLIGSRLGYVIQYWPVYREDPSGILALNLNTLSPLTGLATALLAGLWFARWKKIANRQLLDVLTPGLIVFAAGLALADFASGDGYGAPSQLPWAINLWGEQRHPTQLYHLLTAILIGLIVQRASRPFDGARFGLFVVLYAASRLLLEIFHGDSATFVNIRLTQVISLAALITAMLLLRRWTAEWAQKMASESG